MTGPEIELVKFIMGMVNRENKKLLKQVKELKKRIKALEKKK